MTTPRTILVLATTNKGKVREIRSVLKTLPLKIIGLSELGIDARSPETGETFEENALEKSLFYSRKSGLLTLAEDSGLEIEALDGAPGIYSARFSGRGATDEKNIRKVLRLMESVPAGRRAARFVCAMALTRNGELIKTVTGRVSGKITEAERGRHGFGYDPIFFYPPLGRTFGELPGREKNRVSHRGRALDGMRAFLARTLKRPASKEGPAPRKGRAKGGGRTLSGHHRAKA